MAKNENANVDAGTETPAETVEATTKPARGSLCTKSYIQKDGEELTKHATPETIGVQFKWADGESTNVMFDDIGKGCRIAGLAHGISQKLGDSYAGCKTPEDAREGDGNFLTVLELLQADNWVTQRKGAGPRPTMLLDAVVAALVANGEEVDAERRARITEKLVNADDRKATLNNPAVNAQYERIKAERAVKRAKEAQSEATASKADLSAF